MTLENDLTEMAILQAQLAKITLAARDLHLERQRLTARFLVLEKRVDAELRGTDEPQSQTD